jgi:GDP-L-fucose synthase
MAKASLLEEIWGTGTPRREFLEVDDLADAALLALQQYEGEGHLNVGGGKRISIREWAELFAKVVQSRVAGR